MSKRQLLSEILKVANNELLSRGFAKEQRGIYKYPLGQDTKGFLGMGITLNEGPERVGLSPTVGVVHEPIERLVREFCADKDCRELAESSINVGYLMPERKFLTWIFEPSPFDWVHETQKMLQAVELYGIPFMKSHAPLDVIIDDLEHHRYIDRSSAAYRLPVAHLLTGKSDLAVEYAQKHLAELGDRNDLAAQQYRKFASNFLQEVALGK